MIADVIDLATRRPLAPPTEVQHLLKEAHAKGYQEGMRVALESMRAEMPTFLPARPLAVVQFGGWAS